MVALVERGLHNPLAAAIGRHGESEYALAERLIGSLPSDSLLLADRLYGLPAFVAGVLRRCREVQAQFLVRVKANLRARCLPRLADGSALVEEGERNVAGAGDLWAGAYAGGPLGEGATVDQFAGAEARSGGAAAATVCATLGDRVDDCRMEGADARRGAARPLHGANSGPRDRGVAAGARGVWWTGRG